MATVYRCILWLALGIYSFPATAQTGVKFHWGAFQKIPKYAQSVFQFSDSFGCGTVVKMNEKMEIRFFTKSLLYRGTVRLWIQKSKETIKSLYHFQNKICIVTQTDAEHQKLLLRVYTIRTDSINIPVASRDLISLRENRFNRNIQFHIEWTKDGLEVWYPVPPEHSESRQTIRYQKFNHGLTVSDEALIELQTDNRLTEVWMVEPITEGRFLLYVKEFHIRPVEQRGFTPNYDFIFYISDPGLSSLQKCVFSNRNLYPERGKIKYHNGILEASGLFREKTEGPKSGYWFFSFDFNKMEKRMDTAVFFSPEIVNLPHNGFRYSVSRRSPMETFYLDYFIRENEGKKLLVSEQYHLMPATFGSAYTYNRFYGDILLLYLDSTAAVTGASRVLKAQQTFNNFGEFSSYLLERSDSNFRIFYNDHCGNQNRRKRKLSHLVWHKQSCLVLHEFSEHRAQTHYLSCYTQSDGILQVRDLLEVDKNKYLVVARKGKRLKLGWMQIIPPFSRNED